MGRKRQTFSKNFKVRVVLEALREESTIQEIAVKHGVHPNQVSQWKSQAIAGMEDIFERPNKKSQEVRQQEESVKFIAYTESDSDALKKRNSILLDCRRGVYYGMFLDTNVFLECNSISEIDWSLITEDTEITIYICFTVLDELDKFKTDQNNRRRRKAVNSIKLLSQIFEQNIAITHKQQCFHLSVKMADNYANEELKALKGLDISRNDDLIIATVALFNEHTNNNAILISHDLGIRLKGNHFFTCRDVPAKWLLVEEKNEIQKENERLKAELLQFQKKNL